MAGHTTWFGLALYFAVSMTLIGVVRSGHFTDAGLWPRYSIENVILLLVTIAVVFRGHRIPQGAPRAVAAAGAVGAAVYLQVQSVHVFHGTPYEPIRSYVETLRSSLAKLPPDAVIADADIPDIVLGAWIAPFNRTRMFVPIYSRHAVRPREQATVEIRPDGTIGAIR